MSTGEKIKIARKKAGLTQRELGEKLGVSQSAVGQFEMDRSNPNLETLEKIASALKTPISELLDNNFANTREWKELEKLRDKTEKESTETLSAILNTLKEIITRNDECDIFTNIPEEDLLYYFWLLNENGQNKAIEQVGLLTEIPKYQKEND